MHAPFYPLRIGSKGISMRTHVVAKIIFASIALFSVAFFASAAFQKRMVFAKRVVLEEQHLFTFEQALQKKRITDFGNVVFLFDHRVGKILLGREWVGALPETELVGGAVLFVMDDDGGSEFQVTDMRVTNAFFSPNGTEVWYTTEDADMYVMPLATRGSEKILSHAASSALSPDGKKLVYLALQKDWSPGQFFDTARGIAVYDRENNVETFITTAPDDFNPVWTPSGEFILFFGRSKEGLASHFIVPSHGGMRLQLSNIGEKAVSDATVAIPSTRPLWSKDGRFLIYESDGVVWVNEFNKDYSRLVRAEALAKGSDPQWGIDGKVISYIGRDRSVGFVDIFGKVQR